MVADKITVESRVYGADEAFCWESEGADGYIIKACEKETAGTVITIYLKADTEDEKYSEYFALRHHEAANIAVFSVKECIVL